MLEMNNITKVFNPGTPNEKTALEDFSLKVSDGDFITVIGANGAGKSTLFGAIAGDYIPDRGSIILNNKNVTLQPSYVRARVIGRLFQDPMRGTAPGMTIEENLSLAAGSGGWLGSITKADRERFKEKLRPLGMGLEDRMTQPVGLLSGGQRQALTLMMATMNKPEILLLDEHTAALDPATAEIVLKLTKEIVERDKITCLMVTHNMQSALDLGNRTIMMDRGKVIYDVSGDERKGLTVPDLLNKFKEAAGEALNNDRMLLTK